jgi:hypothetical protein
MASNRKNGKGSSLTVTPAEDEGGGGGEEVKVSKSFSRPSMNSVIYTAN